MIQKKTHFADIDTLRTICVYLVIIAHCRLLIQAFASVNDTRFWFIRRFAELSDVGVDTFFCISGFLISFLLFEELSNTGKISIKNFYIRRILRIWPLYFLILVIGFTFLPYFAALINQEYILEFNVIYFAFFAGNYDLLRVAYAGLHTNSVISPLWSISVEEQFYLIWPLLIVFSKKRTLGIILLVFAISFALRLYFKNEWITVYYSSLGFFFLAAGSVLAYFSHYYQDKIRVINRLPRTVNISIYLISISAIIYTIPYSRQYFVARDLLIAVFVCWVIAEQTFYDKSFIKFRRIKFLDFWGKYTYGMYLWHAVCIYFIDVIFMSNKWWKPDSLAVIPYMLSVLLLTHVVSYASYHLFEAYFLRLKHRFA
jgi:peptidoglycan/LPS O-acetylase OafA/YrhL